MQNSFDGIFYLRDAPSIRYEDGLFFVIYEVRGVHVEFVMQPSVFVKTHRQAARAFDGFEHRDSVVTPIRRRKVAKPAH